MRRFGHIVPKRPRSKRGGVPFVFEKAWQVGDRHAVEAYGAKACAAPGLGISTPYFVGSFEIPMRISSDQSMATRRLMHRAEKKRCPRLEQRNVRSHPSYQSASHPNTISMFGWERRACSMRLPSSAMRDSSTAQSMKAGWAKWSVQAMVVRPRASAAAMFRPACFRRPNRWCGCDNPRAPWFLLVYGNGVRCCCQDTRFGVSRLRFSSSVRYCGV